ncbi:hypothetical protein KY289_019502 [Solanum tuberosum]|nr:hypothetical protein KY289_019502 [Solanum tuberosum]
MGLDETYSAARGQILMQSPTPRLNKVFSLIIDHESQRNLAGAGRVQHDNTSFGHQPRGSGGGNQGRGHYESQYNSHKPQKPLIRKTRNVSSYANHVEAPNPAGSTHIGETMPANLHPASPAAFFTTDQYNQIMQLLAKGSDFGGDLSTKTATTGTTNHMTSKAELLN